MRKGAKKNGQVAQGQEEERLAAEDGSVGAVSRARKESWQLRSRADWRCEREKDRVGSPSHGVHHIKALLSFDTGENIGDNVTFWVS